MQPARRARLIAAKTNRIGRRLIRLFSFADFRFFIIFTGASV
jgi:hypothetical protein